MPEGEEEEQEIENLLEKIMENFPNLAKEIDSRKSRKLRESQRSGPKEAHTKAHHITLPKMKDKERILKAAREKETVTYKGVPIRLSAASPNKPCRKKGLVRSIRDHERQGPTSKITLSSKAII